MEWRTGQFALIHSSSSTPILWAILETSKVRSLLSPESWWRPDANDNEMQQSCSACGAPEAMVLFLRGIRVTGDLLLQSPWPRHSSWSDMSSAS